MEQGPPRSSFEIRFQPGSCAIAGVPDAVVRAFEGFFAQGLHRIDSQDSFNRFCRGVISAWQQAASSLGTRTFPTHARLNGVIRENAARDEMTPIIPTPWGGVVVERHAPPQVEKWLVINRSGYLALEWHEQKEERIESREGVALLLEPGSSGAGQLQARLFTPGAAASFRPGDVHCLIGLTDCAVFEMSNDPKGMDKDLKFIFVPQ